MIFTCRLTREPHPARDVRTEVHMVLWEERRGPGRVRPAEQRVRAPQFIVEVERLRDSHVREHGAENGHDLGQDLCLRESFNAPGERTLEAT